MKLVPLHQHQIDVAVRKGWIPAGEVPRALERFQQADTEGRLFDLAEAIAEVAGLTRSQAEEIRREAKSRALSTPSGTILPPPGFPPPKPPAPPPPAPPRRRPVVLFGILCVVAGSWLTILVTGSPGGSEIAGPAPAPLPPAVDRPVEPDPHPADPTPPAPRVEPRPEPRPDPPPRREVRPPERALASPRLLQSWLLGLPDEDLAALVEDERLEDYERIVVDALSRRGGSSPEAEEFLDELDRRVEALADRPRER